MTARVEAERAIAEPDEFMDYDANPHRPDPKDTRDE